MPLMSVGVPKWCYLLTVARTLAVFFQQPCHCPLAPVVKLTMQRLGLPCSRQRRLELELLHLAAVCRTPTLTLSLGRAQERIDAERQPLRGAQPDDREQRAGAEPQRRASHADDGALKANEGADGESSAGWKLQGPAGGGRTAVAVEGWGFD